jgi:coproporphyrinogen III oxidase-like Fe-S oxidoreductase
VGIQALNDTDLKRLGRLHSMAEARDAFDIARRTFPRTSFDLIYARQEQSPEDWRAELGEALSMAADHLSLYQLTIEPGTAFGDRFAKGSCVACPTRTRRRTCTRSRKTCVPTAGLPAYEVSNHARPGAESRHNLIYWRGGDWAGIGPGAHGRLTRGRSSLGTETELAPIAWLTRVETDGSGETSRVEVAAREQAEEFLMMGLRLSEGVRLDRLHPDSSGRPRRGAPCLVGRAWPDCSGTKRPESDRRPDGSVLNAVLRELLA